MSDAMQVIDQALNDSNPQTRAQAVRWLAENVDQLTDEQYEEAKRAVERAMMDSDPTVIMMAMQAMGSFTRAASQLQPTAEEDDAEPVAAMCSVCGKPEWLINAADCEYATCPYK